MDRTVLGVMEDKVKEAIEDLIKQSRNCSNCSASAVDYSQAALNLAYTYDCFHRVTKGSLD